MYSDIFDALNHNFGKSNLYFFQNFSIAGIIRVQDIHNNRIISKLRIQAVTTWVLEIENVDLSVNQKINNFEIWLWIPSSSKAPLFNVFYKAQNSAQDDTANQSNDAGKYLNIRYYWR